MLLSFPYMHQELVRADVPGLRVFDPGYQAETVDNGFRPDGLPLDPKSADALIQDCIRFGEQFKDPAEMAYFGAQTTDDFYEGSSMSIQAQLTRQFADGQGGKEERQQRETASKAQFILLLAWFFEERMMELAGLEKGVKDSWKSIDTTLGVDDDDRINERVVDLSNAESHTGGASDGQNIPLPWARIIEALPVFIDADTVLVCTDSEIIAKWDDQDIAFSPADKELGLPEGAQTATLPAWQFAGRRKEPQDMVLALTELTVAVIR